MKIRISELKKADYKKAVQFAITGMHFDWYLDNRQLLNLYGRYFWYLEMTRATQIIAAYAEGEFVGVLLAEIYGEEKQYQSIWKSFYVKVFDMLQKTFYKAGAGLYEDTTQALQKEYMRKRSPDGEIIFLAADPAAKVKGIGTALLSELERREAGKKIFLHTDNACTYQFYEHRGFERECETDIVLHMGKKKIPLKCLIYSKTF